MHEVPGLVKNFNAAHEKGFEVLGVTLDNANAEEKIKSVTESKGMTWPQIYDGKGWKAELAQKYMIESIPATFLVDGDSGEIVGDVTNCRGEALSKTLDAAFAKRAAKK